MSQDGTHRTKLVRLADALIDEIVATSDIDIISEVGRLDIERARVILTEAKTKTAQRVLVQARHDLEAWRLIQSKRDHSSDRTAIGDSIDRILSSNPGLNEKMMLAARAGKEPTDRDKEGLIEDWIDLGRFENQDTAE
jgi:hypothetical protein